MRETSSHTQINDQISFLSGTVDKHVVHILFALHAIVFVTIDLMTFE